MALQPINVAILWQPSRADCVYDNFNFLRFDINSRAESQYWAYKSANSPLIYDCKLIYSRQIAMIHMESVLQLVFKKSVLNVSCSFEMVSVHESKIFLSVEEIFDLDFVFIFFLFESITNYLALIVRKNYRSTKGEF